MIPITKLIELEDSDQQENKNIIDCRLYQKSLNKYIPIIKKFIKNGYSIEYACCNISAITGIPILVLYSWFYENEGKLFNEIKRLSKFFNIIKIIDSSGKNILTNNYKSKI